MPFNLLILPLVAGFLFVSNWKRTAFLVARSDRTRLVFYASIAGILLVIFARVLVLLAMSIEFFGPYLDGWKMLAPFEYSGTAALTLILSVIGFIVANRVDGATDYDLLTSWIFENGNGMEVFLLEASERANSEGATVMLTLDDHKVYMGWVRQGMRKPHEPEAFMTVVPLASGYRHHNTKQVTFTNFYDELMASLGEDERGFLDFRKVIPISKITSIGYFDPDKYLQFQLAEIGEAD